MGSFTKRFNRAASRLAFWQAMTARLAEFDSLVRRREHLTPEDVKALRQIHRALYECYSQAKTQKRQHEEALERLREELSNEGRPANEPR